jgi:hypothetical protein
MQIRIAVLLSALLLIPGCGGGSSGTPASGPLSGNWQMSLQKDNSNLNPKSQTGFLVQQKNAVTGNMILRATGCSGVGAVSGAVSGSTVTLAVALSGVTVNLNGAMGADPSSMTGTYTILAHGCSGPAVAPEVGTFTANLVKPFTGSFQGTFSSTLLGSDLAVSGQVTQGTNTTGTTSAALTGNLTATDYCFGASTVQGSISGTDVVMNLLDEDGSQIAHVSGSSSLDGKSMTGTYHVIPQGAGGIPPCGAGDGGNVTLTLGQ